MFEFQCYTRSGETADQFNQHAEDEGLPLTCYVGDYAEHAQASQIVITPGNSYGFMDGGFDQAIVDYFGLGVQEAVRALVAANRGYLPVGSAKAIELHNGYTPWLVYAPTMSTPRPIRNLRDVYDSSYAAFNLAIQLTRRDAALHRIGFAPMGGGTGHVPARRCAKLMLLAAAHAFGEAPRDWEQVGIRERQIKEAIHE